MKTTFHSFSNSAAPQAQQGGGVVWKLATSFCLGVVALSSPLHAQDADARQQASEFAVTVAQLKRQNTALAQSLAEANKREQGSADALSEIKARLEALGKNLIDGKDDRMVKAVSDLQILNTRLRDLENSSLRLSSVIQNYLKTALHADPAERTQVESALREMEAALGLREKPQRAIDFGSLDNARVVSIDSETGLLVLNVGNKAGAQIGMEFEIARNNRPLAKVLIAETRNNISGALVQTVVDSEHSPKIGDLASVKLQQNR